MRSALLIALIVLAPGCTTLVPEESPPPLPRVYAALGDSITRAANVAPGAVGDHPEASWATGKVRGLLNISHASRLETLGVAEGGIHNFARSGARVDQLGAQARQAVAVGADYVTILIGANDVCTSSVAAMTSASDFARRFDVAVDVLSQGIPHASVLVVSIPDVGHLWDILHEDADARRAWDSFRVCQSLLSADATDADRAAVRERVVAYNEILRDASAKWGFTFDNGAAFDTKFERADTSELDRFHPSVFGHARLANITWAATPWA